MEIVKALLDHGAEVDARQGGCAYHFSAIYFRSDLLLFSRYTPLMQAAARGHIEVVRELMSRGANINSIYELDGKTALYYSLQVIILFWLKITI